MPMLLQAQFSATLFNILYQFTKRRFGNVQEGGTNPFLQWEGDLSLWHPEERKRTTNERPRVQAARRLSAAKNPLKTQVFSGAL